MKRDVVKLRRKVKRRNLVDDELAPCERVPHLRINSSTIAFVIIMCFLFREMAGAAMEFLLILMWSFFPFPHDVVISSTNGPHISKSAGLQFEHTPLP